MLFWGHAFEKKASLVKNIVLGKITYGNMTAVQIILMLGC
jgi:hypothetical protein